MARLLRPPAVGSVSYLYGTPCSAREFHLNASYHVKQYSNRQYSTLGPGAKVFKWLSRRLLAVLALAGLTGGALLAVSFSVANQTPPTQIERKIVRSSQNF